MGCKIGENDLPSVWSLKGMHAMVQAALGEGWEDPVLNVLNQEDLTGLRSSNKRPLVRPGSLLD